MKQASLTDIYKRGGLEGLLKYLEVQSRRNYLLKKAMDFDKKHFVLLKFLKDIIRIEKGISKYGIKAQAEKLINKLELTTSVYSDITNKNFPNQKGLLIYGVNHNALIEPIILFSLLNQKRLNLMLFRMFHFLGKNIRRYSLPVAARNYHDGRIFGLRKFYDFSKRFRDSENMADAQIIKMNTKSIKSAARSLEMGGNVIIFPGGGGNELRKWGFGISRIILSISEEKRDNVSLLPVYFSGMGGKRMLFRVFRAYKKLSQSTLRVGVYFGKEKTISEMYNLLGNKISEENILEYLRKDAFSQYGLKEFPFKLYLYPKNYPLALSRSVTFMVKFFIQLLPFRDFFRNV